MREGERKMGGRRKGGVTREERERKRYRSRIKLLNNKGMGEIEWGEREREKSYFEY